MQALHDHVFAPTGHNIYNPRRKPGDSASPVFVAPTGRNKAGEVTPRWGSVGLGRLFPRLAPGVIDILPRRGNDKRTHTTTALFPILTSNS